MKEQQLYVRRYGPEKGKEVKGVLQILHGMAEYGGRYAQFAEFLVGKGYVVYVGDHRKHGESISGDQKVGYYTDDTWIDMVDDIDIIVKDILKRESVDSIMMLGHSMGSFLLRTYLIRYGEHVSKAIIMGTGDTNVALVKVAIQMAKLLGRFSGKKVSPFLDNMAVGPYNKPFKPNRTASDWLTRDTSVVDWYINSPLCGYPYTPKFYQEISTGLLFIAQDDNIQKSPKIPMLFISGAIDPVGEAGKGVTKVVEKYKALGYAVELNLIKDARHEILNELNKEKVYEDVYQFMI